MAGNSIGTVFKVTTWGESHGKALGVVIDGCPAGILISEKDIQKEVDRRKPHDPRISTSRKEKDKIEILSGIFEGKTLGTPISIIVRNKDVRSQDYSKLKDVFRPGHADFTYQMKYGFRDYRGGGRSSGRETVARVMAGAVAKQVFLSLQESKKLKIYGHTIQAGDVFAKSFSKPEIEKNPLRCADKKAASKMLELVKNIKKEGDSIGAIVEIIIENVPLGLGEPVFDKLDADLAKAFMSIGAVKGVEFGSGFSAVMKKGSENNDTTSNFAGGILGGISNGKSIIARLAIKPVPSISIQGRHDICLAPRIIPVAESMAAIVILDHLLRNREHF
ncbi:MAG: chorismate synthase [Candidatus Gracilibacteria bacterium]